MNKDPELLKKRREFIKDELSNSHTISKTVKELAIRLFLSERTIWYDYNPK